MDEVAFGRYRLIELIGEGGMGKVYRAHDTAMDRDVAVKVLPAEVAGEPGYEQRFRREVATAARLTEPHIIPIFEAGEIDGRLYLVMPIIDGVDLQTLLRRDGPMSPQRAVALIEQLAGALNVAHQHGLVHRDIKPANALVTDDGFVYLIDFGVAHDAAATRLTSAGMMMGTLAHMAPERFTAGVADARSDVYSLACVLCECLTGTTPYPGDSMEQQIAGHLTVDPPKPSQRRPELPVGLDEVIATGMAKKPDKRYQSARELAIAARGALITAPTAVGDLPTAPPGRQEDPAPTAAHPQALANTRLRQPQGKPAATRQVIERGKLGALTKIGQGGQGVVYGAPNVKTKFAASMVYKEYKARTLAEIDFAALAAMPTLVEDCLTYAQAERLISIAAWPCALVEDEGASTGFVMPAIPEQFFIGLITAKGMSRVTTEFQHLLNHGSVLAARGIAIDDAQRYALLREVASGLAFLHEHGVCVGDISPKNLLFSLAPHETVYFIDCDAMRINGVSALSQMETPGWDAPAGEELATVYTDAYKLGLLALRLLAGDHDTTNLQRLPAATPDLLRQIITDTLTKQPHSRPQPGAWSYVLGHAIEHAQHQKKTAAPAGAALEAPSIPVLRSRPPSSQPVPAWAPPVPAWEQAAPSTSKTSLWIAIGVASVVLTVLIAVSVAAVVIVGKTSSYTRPTATTQAAPARAPTTQPAPTPIGPTPVQEAVLEGLLLSPDQINAAMGATGMTVQGAYTTMAEDDSHVSDQACLPMLGPVEKTVYAASGWTAVRGQKVAEPGQEHPHVVTQDVVLFPSAQDARAFFTASAQRWPACSNRQYTVTWERDEMWTVGPVSDANGVLSATKTISTYILAGERHYGNCHLALTVANNVVVDVITCSGSDAPSATDIARQIAAKVPTS